MSYAVVADGSYYGGSYRIWKVFDNYDDAKTYMMEYIRDMCDSFPDYCDANIIEWTDERFPAGHDGSVFIDAFPGLMCYWVDGSNFDYKGGVAVVQISDNPDNF